MRPSTAKVCGSGYQLVTAIAMVLLTMGFCLEAAWATPPQGYRLIWHDEFDSLSVGPPSSKANWSPYFVRWAVRYLAGNQDEAIKMGDKEAALGGSSVADVLARAGMGSPQAGVLYGLQDGTVQLRAYPLPDELVSQFQGFHYVASMISGEKSHAQTYGYWETRIRLDNVSRGQHFAVWLLPKDGAWPPEIDLLEAVGQHPHSIFVNAHGQHSQQPITQVQTKASPDWITVGFLWTPTLMRWTIDGSVVREQANYINDHKLYLLMSWEIADRWTGPPDASTRWPARVSVDYVRIYQKQTEHQAMQR